MLVKSSIAGRFDLDHLRQRTVFQIIVEIRVGYADGPNIVRKIRRYRLSPLELLHITAFEKARRSVRRSAASAVGRIHIDFPGDVGGLQLLENCRGGQWLAVVVVTHGPSTALIVKTNDSRIMSRGIDKSIQLRRHVSSRIVQAPIDMRLIPGGTGVLRTLSQEFEGLYIRTLRVDRAVVGSWERGVTTRIGRSRTMQGRSARPGVELRQAVERLIWIAVLSPVLPKRAKVV